MTRFHGCILAATLAAASTSGYAVEFPASVLTSTIWPIPTIEVCWENSSSSIATEMSWVKDAINRSWSANSSLVFTGWLSCPNQPIARQNIRIRVADDGAHTKGLGRELDGRPQGMLLNFTFATWNQSCASRREECIRSIAIHEFGHAIGYSHEQNRPDSPAWCHAQSQGTPGDWHVTEFDMDSIMNYCNPKYNNNGQLSAADIRGVKFLYPRLEVASLDTSSWYRLVARKSEQCIHVQGASPERRMELWQWQCETGPQFRFRFERLADGYFRIRSAYGKCFHVRTDVPQERRAPLWQWECEDGDQFKFELLSAGDSWYMIRSKAGTCFHVRNGPTSTAREPLWSWECLNLPQFFFRLERVEA